MPRPDADLAGLGVLAGLSPAHRDLVAAAAMPVRYPPGNGCSARAPGPRAAG